MSRTSIIREEIEERGSIFSAVLIEASNAYIMLLSEGEESLGTLAVSLPQKPSMIGPPLSSVLLGDRNVPLARLLAERLAKTLNKMTLVSVFVRTLDAKEAGPIFLRLLEKILQKKED